MDLSLSEHGHQMAILVKIMINYQVLGGPISRQSELGI
jgi:hypothetical protein